MPHVKDAASLRKITYGKNFLNRNGNKQYEIVKNFANKLLDLQDQLKKDDKELSDKVGQYAKAIMTLQLHDTLNATDESLKQAILDVKVNLPNFLQQKELSGDGRTGFQRIVEASKKYKIFDEVEMAIALGYVGQTMGVDFMVSNSVPDEVMVERKQEQQPLPKEPEAKQKPTWFQSTFKFWGDNRRICEEYANYQRARAIWKREVQKRMEAAEKDMPDPKLLLNEDPELEKKFKKAREKKEELNRIRYQGKQRTANRVQHGIEVIDNIYAVKPVIRDDFTGKEESDGKGYTAAGFARLNAENLDLTLVRIGGKDNPSLTEHQFAVLAMFGGTDPEVGKNHQTDAISSANPIIEALQKDGFSEEEAKEIITACTYPSYSIDILRGDSRMERYFNAVNAGKKVAADALRAYPQDKTKLAQIFSRAVKFAGNAAGISSDSALPAFVQLGGEMINLMNQDKELAQLAKDDYERREKAFCARHPEFQYKSFEDQVRDVKAGEQLGVLQQRGLAARAELAKAQMEKSEPTPGEKRKIVKDLLIANAIGKFYADELGQRRECAKVTDYNADLRLLWNRAEDMKKKIGENVHFGGAASSLPTNLPGCYFYGLQERVTQKAPVMYLSTDPSRSMELNAVIDRIIDEDGLDKKPTDELYVLLVPETRVKDEDRHYEGDVLIKRISSMRKRHKLHWQGGGEVQHFQLGRNRKQAVEIYPNLKI